MCVRGTTLVNGSQTVKPIPIRTGVLTRDKSMMNKARSQCKVRSSQENMLVSQERIHEILPKLATVILSAVRSVFLNLQSDTDLHCSLKIYNGAMMFYKRFPSAVLHFKNEDMLPILSRTPSQLSCPFTLFLVDSPA